MVEITRWTQSMVHAWEYALSGLRSGLGLTEAREMFRSGGGAIRDSSWSEIWHAAELIKANADFIMSMPSHWTIPAERMTEVAWDTQNPYVVQTQLGFFDKVQRAWRTEWRTVEFAGRPTGNELNAAIAETVMGDTLGRADIEWEMLDVIAYHSAGVAEEEE